MQHSTKLGIGLLLVAGLAMGCGPARPAARADGKATAAHIGYNKKLTGVTDMATALTRVKAALGAQGFGVITHIDAQKVMKKKLGVEMRPYHILGACNPKLAHKAISADPHLGLLLPCKVLVFQAADGSFHVSMARPHKMFAVANLPRLAGLASQVDAGIKRAFDAL